ncbi:hypothetical protein O1611_g3828 [Lasiodiplodia mahajangana]|uniref:Uncharacterized protein n=1 Tax=Lasiodiplodia mahajangana TaxID=1108764 RepID=A0ACC2JQM1_9PEZI|nr:hypothetical protein O1611_g3828 [Lasiodiplodia mahajangana]
MWPFEMREDSMMTPSMAVCGPHTKRPTEEYLTSIRNYLLSEPRLETLVGEISGAHKTWDIVARQGGREISDLSQGLWCIQALSTWINRGDSRELLESKSGITGLPLLVLIQITQYLQYLELASTSHAELLGSIGKAGGIQGYCAGLLPACAIACSGDEDELIRIAGTAFNVALAIGIYQEIGYDETIPGATTIILRLSRPGEGDEIVAQFPGCYISAVTDPRTISIVGPAPALKELSELARSKGLVVQDNMDLRGKVHNPENMDLATDLCELCDKVPFLQLPSAEQLRVTMYSNRTAKSLDCTSLSHEIVYTVLAARCEWYTILEVVAEQMKNTGVKTHSIACFGLGDCVPLSAFHQHTLSIKKIDVARLLRHAETQKYEFDGDAIAVVGAACRLPGANNLEELWKLIANNESRCEPIRQDRVPMNRTSRVTREKEGNLTRKYYGNFIDDIDQFDHGFFRIGLKEASYMDPQQRILLEITYEALESSGYMRRHDRNSNNNVGCFIGCSGTLRAFLAGRLSHYFGWRGPSETIDTACSSSLVAIHRACRAILGGECPMAIVGGVNLITGVTNYLDLAKAGFLSPTGQCKPFDASADGYCRADGAGIIVLKRLDDAETAGDQILGVITSTATTQCGLSKSITIPHQPAQEELFRRVLRLSKMASDHISYVEAHGTGTQAGDPIEMSSISQVFGGVGRLSTVHIGAIKGNIGHCEAAAGVAGLLKVLSMLKAGMIPPVANFTKLNPKIPSLAAGRMAISQSVQMWSAPVRAACINSYGAAGSNAALICCEYRRNSGLDNIQLRHDQQFPLILSAHSNDSLLHSMNQLGKTLATQIPTLGDLSFTLTESKARHRFRWMAVASDLSTVRGQLTDSSKVYEVPLKTKPVVLAFSGQTKQTVALDQFLYDYCPRLKHYIDTCDEFLHELGFPSILPAIFDTNRISDMIVLQTATFAAQYSCARCWIDGGLDVAAVVGHSFGELTALVVSGVWTLRDGIRAIATRARLMSRLDEERGVMLALHASVDVVKEIIALAGGCEIACFNAKMSHVVVGSADSIGRVETLLQHNAKYKGISFQRLDVNLGFHSKFTEPLLDDLFLLAKTIPIYKPTFPLITCTLEERKIVQSHIVRHLRDPVYFEAAVQRIEDHLGPSVWLEAGMETPIISMVKRATRNPSAHEFQALSSSSSIRRDTTLPAAVMNLWRSGVDVSFWPFLTPQYLGLSRIPLPPYPFNRTSAWVENVDRTTELALKTKNLKTEDVTKQFTQQVQLVTGPEIIGKQKEFRVNTRSTRFKQIVSAHKVRDRPLCPASMYMECAAMAAQLLGVDLLNGVLSFQNLKFEQPLGINLDRQVMITLTDTDPVGGWDLSVRSYQQNERRHTATTHCSGRLEITVPPNLGAYHRLISRSVTQLLSDPKAERLMGTRAYELFSRVANYGEVLRGISSISMSDNQAVAEIQLAPDQIGHVESTDVGTCNAISLDIIFQVAGLLINSASHCDSESVFAATGLETATLPNATFFARRTMVRVFAEFSLANQSSAAADVFVIGTDNSLAFAVLGLSFSRLPIKALERMLDGANPVTVSPMNSRPVYSPVKARDPLQKSACLTPDLAPSRATGTAQDIKRFISALTGAPIEAIINDRMVVDLGIDSLAAVEVAEHIATQYQQDISSSQLLECSVQDLLCLLHCQTQEYLPSPSLQSVVEDQLPPPTSSTTNAAISTPSSGGSNEHRNYEKLKKIVADVCGPNSTTLINGDATLHELGIDSLGMIELKNDIESTFTLEIVDEDINFDSGLDEIARMISLKGRYDVVGDSLTTGPSAELKINSDPTFRAPLGNQRNPPLEYSHARCTSNPFKSLLLAEAELPDKAQKCGMSDSWGEVSRRQDAITVAYILEAFDQLGVNISALRAGEEVPSVPHIPRHTRAMERYHHILQKHNLIESDGTGSVYLRTALRLPRTSASELLVEFRQDFPRYSPEADIVSVTGPKLADCLAGLESPTSLLFRSAESRKIVENYYVNSPVLATSTELLVDLILRIVADKRGSKVRILEVGAGFGGTTTRLAEELDGHGDGIEYTFTDIAPTLVAKASKTMNKYAWMRFEVLNIEEIPSASLRSQFDIVISTNCIHATTDTVASLRNVRQMLNSKGLVVLMEGTYLLDWYDIVFGLLDGWWLRKDGSYALQPLPARHLNTQHLVIGTMEPLPVPPREKTFGSASAETVVYKEVTALQIPADIYIPRDKAKSKMSLAMMIHGGGHLTLSRKAIRPAQTDFLLEHGVIPVSFDYRLCPQVNLIDGPMMDIIDAYTWMQTTLPTVLERRGILVDPTRIAIIGWSTGGHLAMTTAWTSRKRGIEPPRSILSFYGPTDFESGDLDDAHFSDYHNHNSHVNVKAIVQSLPKAPITSYGDDEEGHGWLTRSNDPRAALLLSLFKSGHGLSLLLNDVVDGGDDDDSWQAPPAPERVAAISPPCAAPRRRIQHAHVRGAWDARQKSAV